MRTEKTDVLIIGAGPAGATTAATLAKYNKDLRVVIVERAEYPRYHIGESLIIELNKILDDIGALERVRAQGFVKKGGATFVWGKDREPWSLLFAEAPRIRQADDKRLEHTFHVERSIFDQIMLDVARGHGAEVVQPATVRDVLTDETGRVIGADVVDANDQTTRYEAKFVVDAGGRGSILARRYGTRTFDPILRNIATYGYWSGVAHDPKYHGDAAVPLTNVIAIPIGWIWFIPVREDLVSIGVVTSVPQFEARGDRPLEEFYREHLASSPEVSKWLEKAELRLIDHAPRKVMTETDFNYQHTHVSGPGWAMVGDAAGFVDPLFSIGAFLASSAGHLLGYTLGTLLADPSLDEARLLKSYSDHSRAQFEAFRAMAYLFYGFNMSKEEWWEKTRALVRAQALPADIDDRDAFIAMTFGFGVNATLFREAISVFGFMMGPQVRGALLGAERGAMRRDYEKVPELPLSARPALCRAYTSAPSAIPAEGTGRLVPVARVDLAPLPGDPDVARFPRHMYVPDALMGVLERLDGARTVEQLIRDAQEASRGKVAPEETRRGVQHLLRSLVGFRAVTVAA